MMKNIWGVGLLMLLGLPVTSMADEVPFVVADNLFDASVKETFGLDYAPGRETVTVFAAAEGTDHYANGVVMAAFKGDLYCMWQSSQKDEDAADTWVAYARSTDGGQTWSEPMVLCPTVDNGYCSSGGWIATEERLVGFINTWPANLSPKGGYTRYVESTDGLTWTEPQEVTMADGSRLEGIFEQDPHVLADGRIVNAAHFQPGLKVFPIYTDDPTGRTGWYKADFPMTDNGNQSVELEPSLFVKPDGTLVMTFRDQGGGSYKVLAATSSDRGETWTKAVKTNMPDSRAKQCAGNLPDGTAFICNNPGRVTNDAGTTWRVPLSLTLSADGQTFDTAYLLRSGLSDDYPARRYEGKSKTLGYSYPKAMVHDGYLYVSYSTNKDDAQYTRVPINNISLGISPQLLSNDLFSLEGRLLKVDGHALIEIYDVSGMRQLLVRGLQADLSSLPVGLYVVRVSTASGTQTHKLLLR